MLSPALIERIILKARAGGLPSPVITKAPPDKAAVPKVLALDCNQWVFLARAHYDKSPPAGARDALEVIRKARASGVLIVLLHLANAVETAKREEPESRERLAQFMVELSGNQCFRPFHTIGSAEKRAAVLRHLGRPAESVRSDIVGYGVDGLMGAHVDDVARATTAGMQATGLGDVYAAVRASPEATIEFIVDAMRRNEGVTREREVGKRGTAQIRATREADAPLSAEKRIRLELANLWDHKHGEDIRSLLRELGADVDAFAEWLGNDDNLVTFWKAIPSVWVPLKLEVESGKLKQRAFAENDFRDVNLYEAALPYANILVTEKYWEDRIRQSKLDRDYGTRVLRRLADLPGALAAEGCV